MTTLPIGLNLSWLDYLVISVFALFSIAYRQKSRLRFFVDLALLTLITFLILLPLKNFFSPALNNSSLFLNFISSLEHKFNLQTNIIVGPQNFTTIDPTSPTVIILRTPITNTSVDTDSEIQMLSLINYERNKKGLGSLLPNPKLQDLARNYAQGLFARGLLSHLSLNDSTPPDRLKALGFQFTFSGENLAFADSVELAHQGLLKSPVHQANILSNKFTQVGIGVITSETGEKIFVQEFTD